jgi:hypothetical protein
MRFLDALIESVAPRLALRRLQARARLTRQADPWLSARARRRKPKVTVFRSDARDDAVERRARAWSDNAGATWKD